MIDKVKMIEKTLKQPQLDRKDIMFLHDCKETKASAIIKKIKFNGDRLGISGKVLTSDYLLWAGIENKENKGGAVKNENSQILESLKKITEELSKIMLTLN